MPSVYDFSAKTIDGADKAFADYRGKVLLIVNVASQCGFTPQYEGLERLYEKYAPQGFEVLAFPCNQFGEQEPGSEEEIKSFCSLKFGVKFPLFAKVDVNGAAAHPLWEFLKKQEKGIMGTEAIKWNFTKFLVDKQGNVLERIAPITKPDSIDARIASLV